jgi:short-subunit dehydrogenase
MLPTIVTGLIYIINKFLFQSMNKKQKTVFITGTDSGIGAASVEHFLVKGWNVVAGKHVPNPILSTNPRSNLLEIIFDITDPAQIIQARDQAIEKFGSVDVIVNNAGYGLFGPIESSSNEQFKHQFEVNVFSLVAVTKAFIPHFRERRQGVIVNVASMVGGISIPQFSAYAASKWAVEGFSESLTYELTPFNIKVKIIEPGTIATNFFNKSLEVASGEKMLSYEPIVSRTLNKLKTKGEKGGSPTKTAAMIFKAATSTTSRLRYRQEWNAHFLLTMRSLIPSRLFRYIMQKAMG